MRVDDNTSISINIVAACILIGWIAFNMCQCQINQDNMHAKYPHNYNATSTTTSNVNATTGQAAPQQ